MWKNYTLARDSRELQLGSINMKSRFYYTLARDSRELQHMCFTFRKLSYYTLARDSRELQRNSVTLGTRPKLYLSER